MVTVHADHMVVPHPKYLLDLKGLDPVTTAPYACSGVTTYSALKKVEFAFNSPIVIFGAGGLGLMALSLLKALGGKGAIIVDIDPRKREAAEKVGALASVDGNAPDAVDVSIHDFTAASVFKPITFDGKPFAEFPYVGRYAPAEREP